MEQNNKLNYEGNIIDKINKIIKYLIFIFGIQILIFFLEQSINSNSQTETIYYSKYEVFIQYSLIILLIGYISCMFKKVYLGYLNKKTWKDLFKIVMTIVFCSAILYVLIYKIGIDNIKIWFALQMGLLGWGVILGLVSFVSNYMYQEAKPFGDEEGIKIAKDKAYIPSLLEGIYNQNLKNYIAHQLYTYAIRARFYKIGYYFCSIISLAAPSIVVVINSLGIEEGIQRIGVAVFSAMASIASGLLGIVKFKESWIRYRYNCERLKLEIVEYVNGVEDYTGKAEAEKIDILSAAVDKIVSEETNDWRELGSQNSIVN